MNIFGAFTFGRLIKTFLPGIVLFAASLLYLDTILTLLGADFVVTRWAIDNPILTTVATVPASVILGIFLNTIVFGGLLDTLVRKPVDTKMAEFNGKRDQVIDATIDKSGLKELIEPDLMQYFRKKLDFEAFLLPRTDLNKLVFLQESYWYYLEFQINIALAAGYGSVGLIAWYTVVDGRLGLATPAAVAAGVGLLGLTAAGSLILIRTARLNYERHKLKLVSMWLGYMTLSPVAAAEGE